MKTSMSQAGLDRLHQAMAARVAKGDMPGIVTLVARGDEVHVDAIGTMAFGGDQPMLRENLPGLQAADAAEAELRTDRSQPLSDMERLICAVSTARASRGATGSAENRRSAPVSLRQRVAPCVQGVAHMSWSGERSVSTSPRLRGVGGWIARPEA